MRIETYFARAELDGRASGLATRLSSILHRALRVDIADVFLPESPLPPEAVSEVFVDPVLQRLASPSAFADLPEKRGWDWLCEVAFKPGVTDTLAITSREALGFALRKDARDLALSTARCYLFFAEGGISRGEAEALAAALHNPLIQRALLLSAKDYRSGARPPESYPGVSVHDSAEPELFDLAAMDDAALEALSRERLLALSLDEMRAVRAWISSKATLAVRKARGLPPQATDVEIEMVAQTWSEHCKHKIFNATIDYEERGADGALLSRRTVKSLFKTYIRATTEELAKTKDYLLSVFTDNSGVVRFNEDWAVCVKAETHNSPSALDPYGGAITGIVGVNRDILGTGMGARPIFNTDVLCFADPRTADAEVPAGLIKPRDLLAGVHRGIVDGGNQSGIPVAAGAFVFDESFVGKPLVFCGTGGIMPLSLNGKPSWEKEVKPGRLAVMVGGRVGKDGIHGATFSSLRLDESSPVSAVQIGDPIIQRRMADFLLEARDLGHYEAITDNGAGGLSSSLGEMAEGSGGIVIDLDACPLKYPGLSPWEILVSESQERMSLSVAPESWEAFADLAKRRGVEATIVGAFDDSGFIELRAGGRTVGLLSMDFLHRGLPELRLKAVWRARSPLAPADAGRIDLLSSLYAVLADPDVASKEGLVRQYDHEVQAQSIEKPFTGVDADAPSDGGVLKPLYDDWRGLTVTHGICPRLSAHDTRVMAKSAVDEAYRAHIALGGDPDRASALDNFCWPDPVASASNPDGEHKLAQLVRACEGLREACLAYGLPLISGKDSMKNDALAAGRVISVKPTLLVTLMGTIGDVRKAMSTDFLAAGDLVYVLGRGDCMLGASVLERCSGSGLGPCPDFEPVAALQVYRALARAISGKIVRSCHDLADGGLAVALAESCLGGRLGARISIDGLPGAPEGASPAAILFSETPGRLLVSVRHEDRERFEATMTGLPFRCLGETEPEPSLEFLSHGKAVLRAPLAGIEAAFKTALC